MAEKKSEVAAQIAQASIALHKLALEHDLKFLAYLLRLVILESERSKAGSPSIVPVN